MVTALTRYLFSSMETALLLNPPQEDLQNILQECSMKINIAEEVRNG
jgi:hypothetical protein